MSVLIAERVSKQYAGVRVLDAVSIAVGAREVVGVVGANGAGKSTLLKLLAGCCRPDGGRILLRGRPVAFASPAAAADAGIGMVFQEQSLLPNLSVAENIFLGHERAALRAGVFYDWRSLNRLAAAQLRKLGCAISPAAPTDALSFGERQLVELARVLTLEERVHEAPVILLDEPTCMLEAAQLEIVLARIEALRARSSVVFVSHRLDEVLRVCDRIYVMRGGRCVAECAGHGCAAGELRALMLGPGEGAPAQPAHARQRRARLRVQSLSRAGCYRAVSFAVRAGEVLGLAGVAGAGRESLCRTLFGAEAADSGSIELDGRPLHLREPADAVRHGIAYVPAERHAEGIVGGLSVRENMSLAHLPQLRRGPFIDLARESALVARWIARLRITPPAAQTLAHNLSGGNQQKVVLAKWLLAAPPNILILDHPLRGLDVGAKAEAMQLIGELAASGIGILLIADSVDELIAMSDAIIVMKDGVVSGRFACARKPRALQILERMV